MIDYYTLRNKALFPSEDNEDLWWKEDALPENRSVIQDSNGT
ncbi:MAG: hypothetical protein ACFFEF_11420 [Candidatus Thorarchaeota archaeon]